MNKKFSRDRVLERGTRMKRITNDLDRTNMKRRTSVCVCERERKVPR